jgi:hypothetical protein
LILVVPMKDSGVEKFAMTGADAVISRLVLLSVNGAAFCFEMSDVVGG